MALLRDQFQPSATALTLEQRANRQAATYWKVRVTATIDRLEREARRMLQLENDLSEFAETYYATVGEVVERLAQIEFRIATDATSVDDSLSLHEVRAQRDTANARRNELKQRYRTLAKEIHPDRAMVVENTGSQAHAMHVLNAAYQQGDMAALLKLEAQIMLERLKTQPLDDSNDFEKAVRDIERAADTYASGYRNLLSSPLNELMLRAMSARLAGRDWMQAVVQKVERKIQEKERFAALEHIAQIGAWRHSVNAA